MFENLDLLARLLPSIAVQIGMALVCGFLLGIERERQHKPAGLRTIMLITVGATIYMIISTLIPIVNQGPEAITRSDPARIAAQVVTGIGFLGAGTIIQARGSVQGLTTAALIWVAAGIGLCIGVGFPLLALGLTLVVLLILVAMRYVDRRLRRTGPTRALRLIVPDDELMLQLVERVLNEHHVPDGRIERRSGGEGAVLMAFSYTEAGDSSMHLLHALARIEGVRGVPSGVEPGSGA